MQDPAITLIACLVDNWTLSGDLASDKIKFSTSWFDEDEVMPQITVTPILESDIPFEIGYGVIRLFTVYQVDIWIRVIKDTNKGRGVAKKWRWDCKEETLKIIKANMKGLTDIKYLFLNQIGRYLPEPKRTPPVLRFSQPVEVIYDI